MNKTEKWIVSGLCTLFLAMLGYIIGQVDSLKTQVAGLSVQVATVSTKLDMHLKGEAGATPPAKQAINNQTQIRHDP